MTIENLEVLRTIIIDITHEGVSYTVRIADTDVRSWEQEVHVLNADTLDELDHTDELHSKLVDFAYNNIENI